MAKLQGDDEGNAPNDDAGRIMLRMILEVAALAIIGGIALALVEYL